MSGPKPKADLFEAIWGLLIECNPPTVVTNYLDKSTRSLRNEAYSVHAA
jgi:hypothetical protein